MEASSDIPYKLFVNTGSSSEYGYKPKPMKEIDVLVPDSFYAATKASGTLLTQVFARKYQKPICTFRLFSVYGPYEEPTRFVPIVISSAIQKTPVQITAGKICRDFIYVDDVVSAYIRAMNRKITPGEIFNIGTGLQFSNDEIARVIKKINLSLIVQKGAFPKRLWDTGFWVADISKTKKLLGWKPQYTLEKGLKKTYAWIDKNISLYQ